VFRQLKTRQNEVRVEGNTDNVPISNGQFPSNWELSAARATGVARYFVEDDGLAARRISALGYGEYRPKFPNDTDAHRASNRRVDVVILEVPSYLTVHHGEALTPLADAVLVVGERRTTTVSQVRRTKEALKRLGAPVVGMALTRSRERTSIWGNDSDLDELYDESDEADEVDDPTEQIPAVVSESVGSATSVPLDERAAGDDTPPEA